MTRPDHIPVEDLFAEPQRIKARISPDGTRVAFLAPWKNRLNVWVQDLDSREEPQCVTADETRSVQSFHWTDDPRWLLYLQDDGGDENWHLFRADVRSPGTPAVDLTPFPGARVVGVERSIGRPGRLTMLLNARTPVEFDLHELDVATGELTMLGQSPGLGMSWFQAGGGELLTSGLTAEGDVEIRRPDAGGTPQRVLLLPGADHPLGYLSQMTPDGTGMWIGSNEGTDRTRLVHVDLSTGEQTEVDSHPEFDLDPRPQVFPTAPETLIRNRRGDLLGARYLGERQEIRPLDPHFAAVLAKLGALSDGDLGELSSDDSGQRWIVSFNHDRDPGAT